MSATIWSYDQLDPSPNETDRWADDPTLPVCALAEDDAGLGDCDGAMTTVDVGRYRFDVCDHHQRAVRAYVAGIVAAHLTVGGR